MPPDIAPQSPAPRIRLTRLDALRGLAALGVVCFHMASWPGLHPAVIWPLGWLFNWGWTLVDLFFVLSGYVFAHVYGGGQLSRPGALGDFWVARAARLYPLHLATLACFALFVWDGENTLRNLAWHITMLQGFDSDAINAFNGVSWSISIELACYVLFSLAAHAGDRALRAVSVLMVLMCGARLAAFGHFPGAWTGQFLPRGGLGFFLGQLQWRWRGSLACVPWPLLVLTAAAGLWFNDTAVGALLPLIALSWSSLILLALRLPWLDHAWLRWLGERSLSLYMVHMLVVEGMDALWPPHALGPVGLATTQTAILAGALAAAEVSHRLIEVPARQMIRARWAAHHAPDPATGAQPA